MKPTRDFSVLDHISAPVFVLHPNEDGVPVYVAFNKYALSVSGRPLSDYLGRTAEEVYPEAFGRTTFSRHCDVLKTGKATTYQVDLPINRTTRTVRTTLRPELDDHGKVAYLFGTSKDMEAEKQTLEAKVQFDTLSSEMEQFVAMAAHDLRAPMRHIASLTDLLKEDFQDYGDGKLELLDMLEHISLKSMDLIADVLSHAEIGRSEAVETVFSFPVLCNDICDVLDPHGAHNITTSSSTIEADRTALHIALRNIVENALKHGGKKSLDLHINVQPGMPGMVEVMLTDNGLGFSDASLKVMNGGQFKVDSGYGLFGVKRLISARGGTFEARNLPDGNGAVVRFSLPGDVLGVHAALSDQPHVPRLRAN